MKEKEMKMFFIELDNRLHKYAVLLETIRTNRVDVSELMLSDLSTMVADILQASWFVSNMTSLAIKDWSVEEEEFLKEEVTKMCRGNYHIDDVAHKIAAVTRRPFMHVLIKIINFGFTGIFYDIPERLWFTKNTPNDPEVNSEDIPF